MTRVRSTSHRPARRAARLGCQVVRMKDFRLIADRIVDLSSGGARVGPADPVLTGERVIVSFQSAHGAWIDAEATVARVVHGRRPGEHTRLLGLRFESLDAASRAALEATLRAAVPTAPGARRERRVRPRAPSSPRSLTRRAGA